ncbi:hypothetical protein MAR_021762 [Mya arenaria]|uniref:Uncharacterized protein n=1 Tax=Mya arenaria TaxID=6604 RepID=A0ABY7E8K1_MYAAR|nr:hypothetical protein MAR_021762 [Mya arenaria]
MPYTRSRKRIGRIRPIKKRKRRSVPAQQSRDEPIIEYLEDIKGTTAIPNAADINHSRECNENSELWKKLGITIERYDDDNESDAEEVSNVKGIQKSINEGNEILNEDKDRNRIKYENIRINIVNTNTSITGFSLEDKGEVIPFSDNQIVVKTEILDDSEFNSAHQSKYDDHFLGKEVGGNTYMYVDTPKLCLSRETDNVIEYKNPNYETDNLCVRIKSEPIENGNPSQASSEEQLDNSYHTTEKKLHGSAELHLDNCHHATEKPLQGCSELQLDNICHRTEIKIELDDTNIVNGTMDKHQIDWVIRQSEPYRDGEDEVVSVIPAVGEENDIAEANVDDRGDATIPGLQRLHTHCKPPNIKGKENEMF